MRTLVPIVLCLCNLFVLLGTSQARQNIFDVSLKAGKETWLASILSSVRRVAVMQGKWSLTTTASSTPERTVLDPEIQSQLQVADEKIKNQKSISSALKAVLSDKSERYHSPSSHSVGRQVTGPSSIEKIASLFSAHLVPKPSPPVSPVIEINSTAEWDVVRQSAGESASPTPIPNVLFDEVVICKARNPIWNVGIRTKMGELLVLAYPGSLEKAETFARCIRDDVTTMKREEYLKFAVYNCVGTDKCPTNSATGVCSCLTGVPERCINVDYTRALIECKYGPGVGA